MAAHRPRRRPFLLAIALVGLLGVGGTVLADPDEEAAADAAVRGPPMTAIAAGALGRAALVVVGRSESVREGPGVQVATLSVEQVVRGRLPEGRLTILVGGPRPTNDRRRPSAPYLRDGDGRRRVFFLERSEGGVAFKLDTLFEAEGLVGDEKTRTLIEHARLMAIPDADARARATLAWLLEAQTTGGTWTRVHAAREINYLARVWPQAFDAEARQALDRAARASRVASQRSWLCRAMKSLTCLPPDLAEETRTPPELRRLEVALEGTQDDAERVAAYLREAGRGGGAALPRLLDALGDEDAAVQVAVIEGLVAGGGRDAVPALRARYSRATEPEVHRAIVEAIGHLGDATDVPWLVERLQNGRIRRETMFALARIRTPEAVAALQAIRTRNRSTAGGDDIVALADYLLGRAFVEIERAEGRAVGEARAH